MKDVVMFMTSWCPYCREASAAIERLRGENKEYEKIEIVMIDEDKEKRYANQFDYYLVPTFYVDGEKVHEGAADIDCIRKVFEKALK